MKKFLPAVCFVLTAHAASSPAVDQESFYKGKALRIVVATSAGGGFDAYTRTIARHLGRHIPG